MLYARIVNNKILEWPLTERILRFRLKGKSLPKIITDECLEGTNFYAIKREPGTVLPAEDKNNKIALGEPKLNDNGQWVVTYELKEVTGEEYRQRMYNEWAKIRKRRDFLMRKTDWRVLRNIRETTMGLEPSEDITPLENYRQQLADITRNEDPFKIVWPNEV